MSNRLSIGLIGTAALLAASASGCFVTESPGPAQEVSGTEPPPATNATVIVKWTIAGLTDPNECTKSEAKNIEISIVEPSGDELAAYQQACTSFSTSIRLRPGSYTATAALLDDEGNARTTDVSIPAFTLRGGDELTIPVDFPSNSFR